MDGKKVCVVFRTHIWNRAVEMSVEAVRRYTNHEIVISVDETNTPVPVPSDFRKIVHTVDTFAEMGLPIFPSREKLLWHSGDYPLYQIKDHVNADFIFLMEGDSSAAGPIDTLFSRLVEDDVGYCPRNFRPLESGQTRDVAHSYFSRVMPSKDLFVGSFASFWIDRTAIDFMLAERRRMAELVKNPDEWVYCEAFSATVAHASGFKCAQLWDYADMRRHKWLNPVRPEEIVEGDDGRVRFYHPVLDSPKWEQKRLEFLESEFRQNRKSIKRLQKELAGKEEQLATHIAQEASFFGMQRVKRALAALVKNSF